MRQPISILLLVAGASLACTADSVVQADVEVKANMPSDPEGVAFSFAVLPEVHTTSISGIRDSRRTVIRTASAWEEFWSELTTAIVPTPDLPAIDFDAHMVIVAAMGEQATGGYAIAIDEVSEAEDGVRTRVVETSPGAGCLLAQVSTAPVTAVAVTRREGSVEFVEETGTLQCAALSFAVLPEVHTTSISGIGDSRRTVIRTASAWEEFWSELTTAIVPTPDLPAIDFDAQMVIVAAMGEQATGGYAIAVDEVSEAEDGVRTRVVETSPGAGCVLAQVSTAPVTAVAVTRREGSAIFVEEAKTEGC